MPLGDEGTPRQTILALFFEGCSVIADHFLVISIQQELPFQSYIDGILSGASLGAESVGILGATREGIGSG